MIKRLINFEEDLILQKVIADEIFTLTLKDTLKES